MLQINVPDTIFPRLVLSSFYWMYILSNFLSGAITDKFGGKHTLGLSTLLVAMLTILTPAAIEYGGSTLLIWLRVLMGLGQGVIYPALSVLLAQWIPTSERARAGSMAFAASSFGTIFGMSLSGLILQHSDWPMVFYFFGSVGILSFLLTTIFCFDKPSKHPYISIQEADYLKESLSKLNDF